MQLYSINFVQYERCRPCLGIKIRHLFCSPPGCCIFSDYVAEIRMRLGTFRSTPGDKIEGAEVKIARKLAFPLGLHIL